LIKEVKGGERRREEGGRYSPSLRDRIEERDYS